MPTYTCGLFSIGKAKQNPIPLNAFVNTAIAFVNFEPPLSIATRLSNPVKMIAIPEPTNQSVSVFKWRGKAKLICITPKKNNDIRYCFNYAMHSRIYSFVLVGKLQYHSCKTHNNRRVWALELFGSLYTYRSIDKHQQALFRLSESHS